MMCSMMRVQRLRAGLPLSLYKVHIVEPGYGRDLTVELSCGSGCAQGPVGVCAGCSRMK